MGTHQHYEGQPTRQEAARVAFGPFVLDRAELSLFEGHRPIRLTMRATCLLDELVVRAGALVTRDRLVERVWQQARVSDAAIAKRVQELRNALGDQAAAPRYIGTVYGRGLRFLAPVRPVAYPVDRSADLLRDAPSGV